MPPVTPAYNGVLRITYVVQGITHHHDCYCDISVSGSTWSIVSSEIAVPLYDPQDAADRLWVSYAAYFYPNTVVAPLWTLYQLSGISLIPVAGGSCASAGSGGSGIVQGQQLSFTFKDPDNHRINTYWYETLFQPPAKSVVNSTPSAMQDYIDAHLSATAISLDPYFWRRSRGDGPFLRYLRWTSGLNYKIQRRRGLA